MGSRCHMCGGNGVDPGNSPRDCPNCCGSGVERDRAAVRAFPPKAEEAIRELIRFAVAMRWCEAIPMGVCGNPKCRACAAINLGRQALLEIE